MTRWDRLLCDVVILLATVGMGRSQNWHFAGENIALNKPTKQWPGTHSINGKPYPSGLAVDGNTANNFWSGSCSHTTAGTGPYWSVDLSQPYFVKGIRIYTRQDEDRQNFDNFKVVGFPNETTLHDDATADPKLARTAKINIPIPPTQFSNITIIRPEGTIIVCEVELYGAMNLTYCSTESIDYKLTLSVSYGFMDTERSLVVEDSVVQFSCPTYYTLTGAASVTCLSTGLFNASLPRCLETPCQPPSTIQNGAYNQYLKSEYSYHETVTWECSGGYKSDQNRTRQCLPTSKWSGTDPVCTLFTCPYPSSFSNGVLEYQNGTIYNQGIALGDTIVTVSCDQCFTSNTDTTVCSPDEVWSPAPQCTQVECASLGTFNGGQYNYSTTANVGDNYVCGTVAEIYCYDNFKKIVDTRTCGQNGSWSGSDTQPCERICNAPLGIEHGFYNEELATDYSVGDVLTWECSEGYKSQQNRTRQCLDTSTWSGTDPECTLITCLFPDITSDVSLTFENGTVLTSGPIPSRTIITVSCDECFAANVTTITCGLDEEWDNQATCSHIECDNLGSLPGGNYSYKDKNGNSLNNNYKKYACGTVVGVYCGDNYNKTADNRTCGTEGTSSWSGNEVPCVSLLTGEETSGPPVAIIGGAVAAVVVLAAVVGVLVFVLLRRSRRGAAENGRKGDGDSVAFNDLQDDASHIKTSEKPDVGNGNLQHGVQ